MAVENCPNCDYVSDVPALPSNGKCSDCHGTGYETDILEALAESLSGQSQRCKTCGGSGKCQTCYGKGYLIT
jgi:DnaJ-class molecular chaperone